MSYFRTAEIRHVVGATNSRSRHRTLNGRSIRVQYGAQSHVNGRFSSKGRSTT